MPGKEHFGDVIAYNNKPVDANRKAIRQTFVALHKSNLNRIKRLQRDLIRVVSNHFAL